MLFGWLVGRAAADLGLAQALATSEAQRVEQFKRLEDSLLAQIHELQNHASASPGIDIPSSETVRLKAEFDSVAERLARLETIAQQAMQARDEFTSEAALRQAEMGRQEHLLEAQRTRFQEVAEALSDKFQALEEQIRNQPKNADQTSVNLNDIGGELRAVADRMARIELSMQQVQAQASAEADRIREQAATLMKGEHAAIRAELSEQ